MLLSQNAQFYWSGFLHESALLLLLLRRCFLWKSPGNFPGKIPPAVIVLPVWSIWAGIVLPTDQSDCSMPPSHVINEHGSQLSLINILTFISNTSHPCYSSCINVSKSCTGPCMKRQQLANSRSSFEKDNLQTKVYLEILNTFHCDRIVAKVDNTLLCPLLQPVSFDLSATNTQSSKLSADWG